jgi:hypothetical protein
VAKYNKKLSILQQLPARFRGGKVTIVYVRAKDTVCKS